MSCPVRSTLLVAFLALTGAIPTSPARAEPNASATFHVSGRGKDTRSGTLATPDESGTDGPFATPSRARDEARRLRKADEAPRRGNILFLIHAGRYERTEPLAFIPEDSGTAPSRTILAADPLFMDPDRNDFRLRPDSPALKLAFRSPGLSTVGPRDPAARRAER